ncbi:hypothetical protein BDR03DRAFT_1003872 [Suillus americanus]|nr:hypothetical protein BDR03DRAFT_1003872 [Suillus americanus]
MDINTVSVCFFRLIVGCQAHLMSLAAKTFYPPYNMCPDRGCDRHKKGLRLSKAQQLRAIYFSLDDGAVPAYSISMQCEGCSTTYHHNYKVAGDDRIYYDFVDGLPDVLQVASHYFVDTRIGRLWKTMMHTACTSATNCARIYNSAMAQDNRFPPGWKFSPMVTMDHVWDMFIIMSLLDDSRRRQQALVVPQNIEQALRFQHQMALRNQRMRAYGQPLARRHHCVKCTRLYKGPNDQYTSVVRVIVVDGVMIGRPCCSISYCANSLRSVNDRFCPTHMTNHGHECVVLGCSRQAVQGRKTCSDIAHKAVEELHALRGQSRFQLQERLERSRAVRSHPLLVESDSDNDGAHSDEGEQDFTVKSQRDKRTLRAQFGRNRTCCEVLIVLPCGLIWKRTTMYKAEAVGAVAVGLALHHASSDSCCA